MLGSFRRSLLLALALVVILSLGPSAHAHLWAEFAAPAPGMGTGPAAHPFPPGSARLYRFAPDWNALIPLDMRSLADLPTGRLHIGLRHPAKEAPTVVVSSDGARFAVLYNLHPHRSHTRGRDLTLQLFDASSGAPLAARHHPAVPFWPMGISADGSIAYGFDSTVDLNESCGSSPFVLIDTRTGRLVRRLTIAARPWDPVQVAPNLDRLYTLTAPDHISLCGSQTSYSPLVSAYDLLTGTRVATLRVKGVLAGDWDTKRQVHGETVSENWNPGFALSPDGSQLAILDGHNNMLTLLRTQPLQIAATEPLTRPHTVLETVASVLGLTPAAAEAKGEIDGATVSIQYTANGHSLLVTGTQLRPSRRHLYSNAASLGLRLVDVADGEVRATYQNGSPIFAIWPAPDGSAVYSMVPTAKVQGPCRCTLQRHDPNTLQVTAARTFSSSDWPGFFFLQARR